MLQTARRLLPEPAKRRARAVRRRVRRIAVRIRAFRRRPLRLLVGASSTAYPGWVATEEDELDLTDARAWTLFRPGTIDAILAEHVWEHMTADESLRAAELRFRYLRPGGYLRLAVPDGNHPDPNFIEMVRPGATVKDHDVHEVLYTERTLREMLQRAGFEVRALEHYDDEHEFHYSDWSPDDGMIRRSKRFEERGPVSVIVDAVKPS